MSKQDNKIWVLETNRTKMQRINESAENGGSPYVFSGPCAEFDVTNDNDRVYSKDDYLPHLEYLKEEIAANSLLGELDHNEDYMVSMKAVSHIIRDIWYDEDKKQVWIKIELLDTRDGRDAMAMVDKGVPLYISSRASGYIDDDGNVTLEKIYTYDIVYRPGFPNAKLERLNESLGIKNPNITIFEWSESAINNTDKKSQPMSFATKEDLKKIEDNVANFGNSLTKQIDAFKVMLSPVLEALNNNALPSISAGKTSFSKVNEGLDAGDPARSNEASPKAEDPTMEVDKTKLSKEKSIAEEANAELKTQLDDILEKIQEGEAGEEAMMEFMTKVKEQMDNHGNYMNLIAQFANKLADFCDMIAQRVNVIDGESQEASQELTEMKQFLNLVAGRVNEHTKYNNIVAKRVNEIDEDLGNNVKRIDQTLKIHERSRGYLERRLKRTSVSESRNTDKKPTKDLTSRVDEAVASVEKKRAEKAEFMLEAKYPFYKFMDSESKSTFAKMDDAKKKRVLDLVVESNGLKKSDLSNIVKNVNDNDELALLMSAMPKRLNHVWENLSVAKKNQVIALSSTRDIRNTDEAVMFWESLDFGDSTGINRVDESLDLTGGAVSLGGNALGYNIDEIDQALNL